MSHLTDKHLPDIPDVFNTSALRTVTMNMLQQCLILFWMFLLAAFSKQLRCGDVSKLLPVEEIYKSDLTPVMAHIDRYPRRAVEESRNSQSCPPHRPPYGGYAPRVATCERASPYRVFRQLQLTGYQPRSVVRGLS